MKRNANSFHEEVFEEKANDIERINNKLKTANDKTRITKKNRSEIRAKKYKEN